MKNKELWEMFYKDGKYIMWEPSEATVKFFGRVFKNGCFGTDALDFGCGVGRNSFFMEKLGLNTYGIDISEIAIQKARMKLEREHSCVIFRTYDGITIPFKDNYFDFVISHGVLDHVLMSKAKDLMKEIHRVLKPNGLLEIEIHSIYDTRFGVGKGIEKHVFIIEDECEKGLPQHFFDFDEILELCEGFTIKGKYLMEEHNLNVGDGEIRKTSFWVLYLEKES